MPTGTAKALPAKRPPSPVINDAATTLPIAAVEVIDKIDACNQHDERLADGENKQRHHRNQDVDKGPDAYDLRHNRPKSHDIDRRQQQHHVL